MQPSKYIMRTYDTYFNDVRNTITLDKSQNDDEAIRTARLSCFLLHPQDTVEVQVCKRNKQNTAYEMFAVVYYEDGQLVVDEIY